MGLVSGNVLCVVVSVVSALNGAPMGDLVLRDFPGPGCPVLYPLELAVVFGLFCTGAVKYVAVPLVFGRGRLPSVVVWSWSMGLARLGAQGAVGVLSGLVAGGVLAVVVLVVCGGVLCLYLLEWGGQGWRRRVIL